MKQFEIPEFYRSPIISGVKAKRKLQDPRKKDFSPTVLNFSGLEILIARHFGFCYGVENAIEIAYRAIAENPGRRIFLLSQMIHNPGVNEDLTAQGITFLQDTEGNQLIDWSELTSDDIVVIPAFGTSLEIELKLKEIGVNTEAYNTTCPFVEKVWNRSQKLGEEKHTIVIHGKYRHEETRATFSHSSASAPSVIVKDMQEAEKLAAYIRKEKPAEQFFTDFAGKYSNGFNPATDFDKIGVVNQTTMLATETQEIAEYLKSVSESIYGAENIREHFADTRDTLCYATNDNQSATYGLMDAKPDLAVVVGGYNSSNTTHLVELLEEICPVLFIKDVSEISENGDVQSFDIHEKAMKLYVQPFGSPKKIAITSGASCPDATVEAVLKKILQLRNLEAEIASVLLRD